MRHRVGISRASKLVFRDITTIFETIDLRTSKVTNRGAIEHIFIQLMALSPALCCLDEFGLRVRSGETSVSNNWSFGTLLDRIQFLDVKAALILPKVRNGNIV